MPIGIVEPMRKLIRLCGVSMTTLWVVNTRHHHTEKTVLVSNTYHILCMKRGVKRSLADLVNILAGILDSEQNFNRSAVPMVTADCGFMQILDPDFGFLLLGSSGCGSQRSPWNLTFSFLCAGCHAVEKWLEIVTHLSMMAPWWQIWI